MRGLTHRWMEPAVGAGAGAGLHAERLLGALLAARGVRDAGAFLTPKLTDLHDPSLMPGLDAAAARLLEALRRGEPTVIYGDYDVDGVCGAAILTLMCRAVAPAAPVKAYIPHRLEEGYGLNLEAIRSIAAEGARLVVTVDCGVTACGPAAEARRLGMDLVITDHHALPADEGLLPEALAVVHPRLGGAYPFGELCGAAVAFKVAWRLGTLACGTERLPAALRDVLLDLLALAGLGTVADVVPLVGENRVIARYGLARLRSTALVGLTALIEAGGLAGERVDSEHVGFILGPRLNAAGRMGHAREALELLLLGPTERGRAEEIARSLTELNDQRRATERAIFERAREMASEAGMLSDDRRGVALAHEDWHAGVLGIVCSRMVERGRRPTVLLRRENGMCHGSGRSVEGVNLHAMLGECADLLEQFGGHDMAAGLRLRSSNLEAFTERFIGLANKRLGVEDLAPALRPDCDAPMADLTVSAVSALGALGPFGRGNPRPMVRVRGLRLMSDPRPLGAHGKHISLQAASGGSAVRMVAWNWAEHAPRLRAGMPFDAIVEPKISTFTGRPTVEPVVCDLMPLTA